MSPIFLTPFFPAACTSRKLTHFTVKPQAPAKIVKLVIAASKRIPLSVAVVDLRIGADRSQLGAGNPLPAAAFGPENNINIRSETVNFEDVHLLVKNEGDEAIVLHPFLVCEAAP